MFSNGVLLHLPPFFDLNGDEMGFNKRIGSSGLYAEIVMLPEEILTMYDDTTTFEYYCTAAPGTSLSASNWKIMRLTKADSTIRYANVNNNKVDYNCVATNLSAVAALSYS